MLQVSTRSNSARVALRSSRRAAARAAASGTGHPRLDGAQPRRPLGGPGPSCSQKPLVEPQEQHLLTSCSFAHGPGACPPLRRRVPVSLSLDAQRAVKTVLGERSTAPAPDTLAPPGAPRIRPASVRRGRWLSCRVARCRPPWPATTPAPVVDDGAPSRTERDHHKHPGVGRDTTSTARRDRHSRASTTTTSHRRARRRPARSERAVDHASVPPGPCCQSVPCSSCSAVLAGACFACFARFFSAV